ncbi:MAG: Coq4 family protein [Polyangiaceae bacterium]
MNTPLSSSHATTEPPARQASAPAKKRATRAPIAQAILGRRRGPVDTMPGWQRWAVGLSALRVLMNDPDRTDLVLVMGTHINASAAPGMLAQFNESESGRKLLNDRPAIDRTTVSLDELAKLPEGTLGREYARMMRDNGLTPDIFSPPDNVAHPDVVYISQRLRQVHDLWHVLTGYSTDVAGEVELQAFTYAQIQAPSSLLIATLGSLRYRKSGGRLFSRAWAAYRRGQRAHGLATFNYEDHWATPVSELKQILGIA